MKQFYCVIIKLRLLLNITKRMKTSKKLTNTGLVLVEDKNLSLLHTLKFT